MIADLLLIFEPQIASSRGVLTGSAVQEKAHQEEENPLIPSCGDYVSRGMKWPCSALL